MKTGLTHALTSVRWYVQSVMGDRDYDRYLAHHASEHGASAPLTEREYWRQRFADQDRNPQGRCC
ncbi:YbdD/YjiX family protein [Gordonia sp. w5E2]|uniref:YbdD/YjiX family protein n=1 Tax=Gordonia jacobaea TaxID=122202 RepID=A0ABR5IGT6_9ACTN|nr:MULTISPECIES: YbdD/YjiX family protein [Gordonia]KNA92772.1 hypothetical protein ABW18_05835 [Gordonia jacobaea]OBB99440.1 hypothetical protein A5785_20755 [Gordonia sp. 852002-50395_SCH5434458]OBC11234.1 hypothetical protein A5788_23190 [Gordonia sp. 852002-50816_SCH5313054-c]OBC14492.1 hypothetical protein A5786_02510 [Gordonia sp. 852002-50816_SCH5313054-a]